jgi:hypothetical protein
MTTRAPGSRISPEERERVALDACESAEAWRARGEAARELSCLRLALTAALSAAVGKAADPVAGIDALRAWGAVSLLRRAAALNQRIFEALEQDGKPSLGAPEIDLALVHGSWLLGEWSGAAEGLAIAGAARVKKHFPMTPFWNEYHRALCCVLKKQPYARTTLRTRGYEKYWLPHLALISALTNGERVTPAGRSLEPVQDSPQDGERGNNTPGASFHSGSRTALTRRISSTPPGP